MDSVTDILEAMVMKHDGGGERWQGSHEEFMKQELCMFLVNGVFDVFIIVNRSL